MNGSALAKSFRERIPALKAWGEFVRDTIEIGIASALPEDRLKEELLSFAPQTRIKDENSFLQKALRDGKHYREPLEQITDQVGVRFVVLLTRDIATLKTIIETSKEWRWEACRDYENERMARPQHFDYQSMHYLVRPNSSRWIGGIEVSCELCCEVQVRSLLQHAYAELAHATVYKPTVVPPIQLSRSLAKGSALVEAADDVFVFVADQIDASIEALLRVHLIAVESYAALVDDPVSKDKRTSLKVMDPFRKQLDSLSKETLGEFLASNPIVVQKTKANAERYTLFGHPVVLVVYWLAYNWRVHLKRNWPLEPEYLEIIFSDLDVSIEAD
jgi:putative GTP pyrophosphokinase